MVLYIPKHEISYFFDKTIPPAAEISSGDLVTFHTQDASSDQIYNRKDLYKYIKNRNPNKVNPVNGPIYIKGAQHGDMIVVHVKKITINPTGFIRTFNLKENMGVLKTPYLSGKGSMVSIKNKRAILDFGISIPISPMIGTIGVAPSGNKINTSQAGNHGGNMDLKDIKEESIIYLPVLVPGGLLSIGDVHAQMGDGEICGTGIETGALVDIKIELLKNNKIKRPWIEINNMLISYGYGESIERAVKKAVLSMIKLLKLKLQLNSYNAYMLISAYGNVHLAQACAGSIPNTVKVKFDIQNIQKINLM